MKTEDMESKLLDYLMGDLDWKERFCVEEAIRTQPEIKTLWEQLQLGLETEVTRESPTAAPRKSLRGEILDSLPNNAHPHRKHAVSFRNATRWLHWSGWGIAACVLFAIVWVRPGHQPQMIPTQPQMAPKQHGLVPVLAVYDLQGTDTGMQQSPTRLKEIIYQMSPGNDTLLRAELIAERLWNNPSPGNTLVSSAGNSIGFVVIDLQGKQGFLGLYQNANLKRSNTGDQHLWLAGDSGIKLKSMGRLPSYPDANEGVYYFSFQNQSMQTLLPDAIMPVINSGIPEGI